MIVQNTVPLLAVIIELVAGIFITAMFTVQTYTAGIVFMGLAGFGMGVIMPTTTKAVLVWFPVKERATAMGFKQTGLNVGGIIAASILKQHGFDQVEDSLGSMAACSAIGCSIET